MGWFFGFKLHYHHQRKGADSSISVIIKGKCDDAKPLKDKTFHNKVFGKKIFADRGYIGKDCSRAVRDGITSGDQNKKEHEKITLMRQYDKKLPEKSVVRAVNDMP